MKVDDRASTASKGTRVLGGFTLVAFVALAAFALVFSPQDQDQGQLVRLMYVHVPSAWLTYLSFAITAGGGLVYLKTRSRWADTVAAASAEIGLVFCGLALATGSIWGRPTWGTYWEWTDVRIVTTLVLFLIFAGYVALRRIPSDAHTRAQRSAVVGIIGALNIPIVRFSVDWWADRTLHQKATVTLNNTQLDGLMLFTLMLGLISFTIFYGWLMLHRFRVAWLEDELDRSGLDDALAQRRLQVADVGRAVGDTALPAGDLR
jgi:heme exporter protein C